MKKYVLLSLVFISVLATGKCLGQEKNNYTLNGDLKDKKGDSIALASGFILGDLYQYEFEKEMTSIINNNFTMEGDLAYPHPFYFATNTRDISGLFF
ncbi:hypothetical protein [Formosa sp. PL04]|uniref:hypothetical protein n=1 Tax=Formosa sp. PL04 TaxID=3081755 RepID=UPI0029812C16|nr:hypothetical protein [Formosa sp. PL04]MDW5290640.1 hypothetical protein [Formosa sp. PL04]